MITAIGTLLLMLVGAWWINRPTMTIHEWRDAAMKRLLAKYPCPPPVHFQKICTHFNVGDSKVPLIGDPHPTKPGYFCQEVAHEFGHCVARCTVTWQDVRRGDGSAFDGQGPYGAAHLGYGGLCRCGKLGCKLCELNKRKVKAFFDEISNL